MKSKILNNSDFGQMKSTISLLIFLETIGIKSASEQADTASSMYDEYFCEECETDKDSCECRINRYDYDYDYDCGDRAYDAWKDAQLENED